MNLLTAGAGLANNFFGGSGGGGAAAPMPFNGGDSGGDFTGGTITQGGLSINDSMGLDFNNPLVAVGVIVGLTVIGSVALSAVRK